MAKEELFKRILFIVFAVPIVLIIIFLPVKYNILILLFILINSILVGFALGFVLLYFGAPSIIVIIAGILTFLGSITGLIFLAKNRLRKDEEL